MAGMLKTDGSVFAPNQVPPPQPSAPQMVQYLPTDPLNQSIAATLNQNNSGVQEMLKGKLKALGITEIVTGIISVIIGIIEISIPQVYAVMDTSVAIGTPWWTGALFIIAGSLAVAVQNDPSHCLIRGCLSMNIISAISCFPAVIIYASNLNMQTHCYYVIRCAPPEIFILCVAILLVLTLLNAGISIAVSSFNCKAMNGCCATPMPIIVVYNNTASHLTPQQLPYENPPPYNVTPMENVYVG